MANIAAYIFSGAAIFVLLVSCMYLCNGFLSPRYRKNLLRQQQGRPQVFVITSHRTPGTVPPFRPPPDVSHLVRSSREPNASTSRSEEVTLDVIQHAPPPYSLEDTVVMTEIRPPPSYTEAVRSA